MPGFSGHEYVAVIADDALPRGTRMLTFAPDYNAVADGLLAPEPLMP